MPDKKEYYLCIRKFISSNYFPGHVYSGKTLESSVWPLVLRGELGSARVFSRYETDTYFKRLET